MKGNAIINFFKKHWIHYTIGVVFLMLSTYIQTFGPKLLGIIIDLLRLENIDRGQIFFYLWMMIVVAVAAFFTRYIWRYLILGSSRNMECYLRQSLFAHFQTLPVQFYHERKTGDLLAYAINDISAVRMSFGPGLAHIIHGTGMCIVVIASMARTIDLRLTILALLPIPVILLLMIKIGGLVQKRFRTVQENFAAISDRVQENISGIRVIKSYVQEKDEVHRFDDLNEKMKESNIKMVRVSSILSPMIELCFGISFMISLIYGSNMVKNNVITLGDFIAFNGYLTLIVKPITSIGRVINITQKGLASFKRLDAIFQTKSDITHETGDQSLKEIKGSIEIKNLRFNYPGVEELALKDISFKISEGKTVGIIGKTGSGKTTLVNLLLRLYNVERGKIFIDGQDINDYPLKVLRENIGYVPQDNFLFSSTIKESIQFFRDIYSDEEIEDATKSSCIYDNIIDFPNGFDTVIGERGVNLSGGQKQRISIARAIVKNPSILILDDALSAVDTKTEESIIDHFKDILIGKTGIIIAHRISAIKHADEIIVMDHGEIVESGTHEELLEKEGAYFEIYEEQYKEEMREKVNHEAS
ncbi:ABC transporter ATP-binding protein [Tissierella sp.]|uniref:ABC transporter ATP-binding protein n=1 Tax=Tissierella sp. TaxID=41274 RepID=UPI00286018C5|nr:ABC transporter ATP-binding protein [Tissierella sp.]MDR7856527.1 ABC transporter ATP-binding protein [Tissierella sp.]